MQREAYISPESESVVIRTESGLCVNGSGANGNYNEFNFDWPALI